MVALTSAAFTDSSAKFAAVEPAATSTQVAATTVPTSTPAPPRALIDSTNTPTATATRTATASPTAVPVEPTDEPASTGTLDDTRIAQAPQPEAPPPTATIAPPPPASTPVPPTSTPLPPEPTATPFVPPPPPTATPVPPTPIPPTPVPYIPPTPTAAPQPPAASLGGLEGQMFAAHNQLRGANGLAGLQLDGTLVAAARARAQDMASRGYFAHTSPTGQTAFTLLDGYGYAYAIAGENIARNNYPQDQSVGVAMTGFMNSPGHRANILEVQFTRVGIGVATDGNGMIYFAVVFAG